MKDYQNHQYSAMYRQKLGDIWTNLQSLEFTIRCSPSVYESALSDPPQQISSLYSLKVGNRFPVNALNSYDSLGHLIKKYNIKIAKKVPRKMVDVSIVKLRDALAHGRISGQITDAHLTLIKFDCPKKGFTKVTLQQSLTQMWLDQQVISTRRALDLVCKEYGSI